MPSIDFSKKKFEMRNILAILIVLFAMFYISLITFLKLPDTGIRFADTAIGFLMGTGFTAIVQYFFGTSQSSAEKNALIRKEETKE